MKKLKHVNKARVVKNILMAYTIIVFVVMVAVTISVTQSSNNEIKAATACTTAGECFGEFCEYPAATYCTYGDAARNPDGGAGECICLGWSEQPSSNNGCSSDPYAEPPACPAGWSDCGTSGHRTDSDPACQAQGVAEGRCGGCNNPSKIVRYCKQSSPPPSNDARCWENCDGKTCVDGTQCIDHKCRNPQCSDESDCRCQQPQAFCGDSICSQGEKCERVSAGSSTYRACTQNSGHPSGDVVAVCRGINQNQPVTSATCKYCGDGIVNGNEQCDYNAPGAVNCDTNCQTLTPGLEVIKDAINGPGPYLVGDPVPFRVTIRNSGETTLTTVRFDDTFSTIYLNYGNSVFGRKGSGAQVDLTSFALVNNSAGTITINDLATHLGTLAPGENYELTIMFFAKAPIDVTCNIAKATSGNMTDEDDACIGTNNRDTDI